MNDFQVEILAMAVRRPGFYFENKDVFNSSIFETTYGKDFCGWIVNYFENNADLPTKAALRTFIAKEVPVNTPLLEGWKTLLNDIYKVDLSGVNFARAEMVRVARQKAVTNALLIMGSKLEGANYDEYPKILGEALAIGLNGSGWPETRDLPTELLTVPALKEEMIPEPLRPWLSDCAERMQCPLEFVAVGALVAISSVIGRRLAIRPKAADDWEVVPNLWGLVIGRPGLLKSPALREAMRPLYRLEQEAQLRFQKASAEYESEQYIAERVAKKKVADGIKEGRSQEELRQEIAALNEQAAPTATRYIVNDATVEKLGELLNENPKGLLLFRDELIGWLGYLDREGHENDRAFFLESWDGRGSYTYDRIKRGTIRIESVCLAVLGAMTPGPLADYLRGAKLYNRLADGLIQRFQLVVFPDIPAEWRNIDRKPDSEAARQAVILFEQINRSLADSDSAVEAFNAAATGPDKIPSVRFNVKAQAVFDAWHEKLEIKIRSGEDHPVLESHLSKYRSLMPSLALIFHTLKVIGGAIESKPVTVNSAQLAVKWCDFLEAHARRIYQGVIESNITAARYLAKKIKNGALPNPFTVRQVYLKGWSGLTDPNETRQAVELLEEYKWLRGSKSNAQEGGRPTVQYTINPRVLNEKKDSSVGFEGNETARAQSENGFDGFDG